MSSEVGGGVQSSPPEVIRAVPVRHPGRWVAVGVVAVLAAMFAHLLLTNDRFEWAFIVDNMFAPPILRGVRTTVWMTLLAMAIGIALGVVVAVMRLSPNPVLSWSAWGFTWFFRAVPRIVLLVLFGNLGILWERLEFGLPFDRQIGALFGFAKGTLFCILITMFAVALLGPSQRESIVHSRSGFYIAKVLDKSDLVMPPELHEVVAPYIEDFEDEINGAAEQSGDASESPLPGGGLPDSFWQQQAERAGEITPYR